MNEWLDFQLEVHTGTSSNMYLRINPVTWLKLRHAEQDIITYPKTDHNSLQKIKRPKLTIRWDCQLNSPRTLVLFQWIQNPFLFPWFSNFFRLLSEFLRLLVDFYSTLSIMRKHGVFQQDLWLDLILINHWHTLLIIWLSNLSPNMPNYNISTCTVYFYNTFELGTIMQFASIFDHYWKRLQAYIVRFGFEIAGIFGPLGNWYCVHISSPLLSTLQA